MRSTTPFNRDLERGIILGGMSAAMDLDLIEVDNGDNRDFFRIRFHGHGGARVNALLAADACPPDLTLQGGEARDLLCKCLGLMAEGRRQQTYWRSIFSNMEAAYEAVHRMEAELRRSLDEKEMLIREIHHRVKNNLAIVQSLLSSQLANVDDKLSKGYLIDARNRVKSISMIHQILQDAGGTSKVDASKYFRDLAALVFDAYDDDTRAVTLSCDIEDVMLDVDTVIPLGLIVNELVSNALKHAFPGEAGGELSVSLRSAGDCAYELAVRDTGIGLPPEVDLESSKSLGLVIIRSLVGQIGGAVRISRERGTEFRITFTI